MWFGNISSQSEAGFVISGYKSSIIENVVIKDTDLELRKTTKQEAGFLDFRPSIDGIVNASSIPAIFIEYASHVELQNFEASFSRPKPHPTEALSILHLRICGYTDSVSIIYWIFTQKHVMHAKVLQIKLEFKIGQDKHPVCTTEHVSTSAGCVQHT